MSNICFKNILTRTFIRDIVYLLGGKIMEMLRSKSIIAFFALVLVVSYISALDNVKVKNTSKSNLISERA